MSKKTDDELVKEAKARYLRCEEWESKARDNFHYDFRFAAGDSSNEYQWGSQDRNDKSVRLTVNKTMQHCLQIINDQRQNESQIEIRPIGNGATYEAAQIFEGIVRHIEYQSNAQAAYSNATFSQVIGGIGWWRVTTDYANDDSFDQEIYIKRVADPMSIYLDPDIAEYDGSDARYAFVFRDMSKEEYEEEYGDWEDKDLGNAASPLGEGSSDGWEDEDHIKICEYYRKIFKNDKLHELDNGMTVRESDVRSMEREARDRQEGDETHLDTLKRLAIRSRDIQTPRIEWYLLAGSKILDKKEWPGKYIPLVRIVGQETVIDKEMDRKGHARSLLDPQRIYNYWSSAAVEQVALIGKTPYIGPSEAIQGYEEEWSTANLKNKAILPYNAYTEDGQPLNAPERVTPPQMAPAYLEGLKIAQQEMMMVSGQYEASVGAKSNEVSGRAVQERRRNGENSTYHFIDHFSQGIQFTGKILVDLIPKIYDVERILKILGEDGTQRTVQVDPNQQAAHQQLQDPDDEESFNPQEISSIFNPNVGTYSVVADIGPAFETRRQETAQAMMQMAGQNKELMAIAGDLFFKSSDFYLADEIARRLKNMVPDRALGKKTPDPQIEQLQQQLAAQHEVMAKGQQQVMQMQQKLMQAQANDAAQSLQKDIDWYKAETDRIKAVATVDPAAMLPIIRQMVSDVLGTPVNPIIAKHAAENEMMPGSATQLANQQHMQEMAQMQAQHAHEAGIQQADQAHEVGTQAADQSHAADMQQSQQDAAQQAQEQAAQQNKSNE